MTIPKSAFAAALTAGAMMGGFADAAVITQTVSGVSLSDSGTSSNSYNLTAFDTNLGTLTNVSIDASGLTFEVYALINAGGGEGGSSQASASFQLSAPGSLTIQAGPIIANAIVPDPGGTNDDKQTGTLTSQNTSSGLSGYTSPAPAVTLEIKNYTLQETSCVAGPCSESGYAKLTGSFAVTYTYTPGPSPVPEPASAMLLGGGLLGMLGFGRRHLALVAKKPA